MKNTLLFALAAVLMVSVVGMTIAQDKPTMDSEDYRKGFKAGCTTQLAYETIVLSERKWILDDTMFNGSREYQQGWFDGRERCEDQLPPRWWLNLWGPAYERAKVHEVLENATGG